MEGQFGRFQKKSSFLFPFALASHLFTGMKREQKSGNGRKTPKWQKERAGKPKFSCTAGEQILKKPRKTPTTVARSPFTPRALSRPESFHVRRRQRTVPCLLLVYRKLAPGPTTPMLLLGFAWPPELPPEPLPPEPLPPPSASPPASPSPSSEGKPLGCSAVWMLQ